MYMVNINQYLLLYLHMTLIIQGYINIQYCIYLKNFNLHHRQDFMGLSTAADTFSRTRTHHSDSVTLYTPTQASDVFGQHQSQTGRKGEC